MTPLLRRIRGADLAAIGYPCAYVAWLALHARRAPSSLLVGEFAFYPLGIAVFWADWRNARLPALDARTRAGWLLLGLSALSLGTSGTAWALWTRHGESSWPAWIDTLELVHHFFIIGAFLAFPGRRIGRGGLPRFLLDVGLTMIRGDGPRLPLRPAALGPRPVVRAAGVGAAGLRARLGHVRPRRHRLQREARRHRQDGDGPPAPGERPVPLATTTSGPGRPTTRPATGWTCSGSARGWRVSWRPASAGTATGGDAEALAPADGDRYTSSVLSYVIVAGAFVLPIQQILAADGAFLGFLALAAALMVALLLLRQLAELRENERLFAAHLAQEARFRSLVQNSSDVVLIVDSRGVVSYVSPAAGRCSAGRRRCARACRCATSSPRRIARGSTTWSDARRGAAPDHGRFRANERLARRRDRVDRHARRPGGRGHRDQLPRHERAQRAGAAAAARAADRRRRPPGRRPRARSEQPAHGDPRVRRAAAAGPARSGGRPGRTWRRSSAPSIARPASPGRSSPSAGSRRCSGACSTRTRSWRGCSRCCGSCSRTRWTRASSRTRQSGPSRRTRARSSRYRQPRDERARRDAGGGVLRIAPRTARTPRAGADRAGGRLVDRGRGRGDRHERGAEGPHLRAVLLDQAAGARHGPRPRDGRRIVADSGGQVCREPRAGTTFTVLLPALTRGSGNGPLGPPGPRRPGLGPPRRGRGAGARVGAPDPREDGTGHRSGRRPAALDLLDGRRQVDLLLTDMIMPGCTAATWSGARARSGRPPRRLHDRLRGRERRGRRPRRRVGAAAEALLGRALRRAVAATALT